MGMASSFRMNHWLGELNVQVAAKHAKKRWKPMQTLKNLLSRNKYHHGLAITNNCCVDSFHSGGGSPTSFECRKHHPSSFEYSLPWVPRTPQPCTTHRPSLFLELLDEIATTATWSRRSGVDPMTNYWVLMSQVYVDGGLVPCICTTSPSTTKQGRVQVWEALGSSYNYLKDHYETSAAQAIKPNKWRCGKSTLPCGHK